MLNSRLYTDTHKHIPVLSLSLPLSCFPRVDFYVVRLCTVHICYCFFFFTLSIRLIFVLGSAIPWFLVLRVPIFFVLINISYFTALPFKWGTARRPNSIHHTTWYQACDTSRILEISLLTHLFSRIFRFRSQILDINFWTQLMTQMLSFEGTALQRGIRE